MSKKKLGVAYMTREQFEERLLRSVQLPTDRQLVKDAVDTAEWVEGGFCYGEIMSPWARWLFGEDWFEIVDLDTYPKKIST